MVAVVWNSHCAWFLLDSKDWRGVRSRSNTGEVDTQFYGGLAWHSRRDRLHEGLCTFCVRCLMWRDRESKWGDGVLKSKSAFRSAFNRAEMKAN